MLWWSREYPVIEASREAEVKGRHSLRCVSMATRGVLYKTPGNANDGSLKICGDYKVTLKPALMVDKHPLPTPESLFATLAGGHLFTKIDLQNAHQQVPLDAEGQKLVTINTHYGLYQYTRLPFSVASAPSIFQRIMDKDCRMLYAI